MAWECEQPNGVMKAICPLHGRPARDDQPSRFDQVNWAGLPINLDFAFSREQRDKVYVQHVLRKRGGQVWRWLQDGAQECACDVADHQRVHTDAAGSMSGQ